MSRSIDSTGNLIVVCGNSGSGKSTLVRRALTEMPTSLSYMQTFTTRNRRLGEDDLEYIFLEDSEYEQRKSSSSAWDESQIYGNKYGLDSTVYINALNRGENFIVCSVPSESVIDGMRSIYGAAALKTIHLLTDLDTSRERLKKRDGSINLARVALDATARGQSDFLANYQFLPTDTPEIDHSNFVTLIRGIIS